MTFSLTTGVRGAPSQSLWLAQVSLEKNFSTIAVFPKYERNDYRYRRDTLNNRALKPQIVAIMVMEMAIYGFNCSRDK